jgi:glycosyltransferase involved in cell wall biosynthesis
MMPVTVIIPTFNRARALKTVWPSYAGDSCVKQIVIVNDGSSDNTRELSKELSATTSIPVIYIEHHHNKGAPSSRMSAIPYVDTEWILFGEDDVYLGKGYISILLRQALELKSDVIAGRLVTVRVPNEFDEALLKDHCVMINKSPFDLSLFDADYESCPTRVVQAPYVHAVALMRRDLFDKIAYDPRFRGNAYREETDFYLSANELDCKVLFSPDTACFHLRGPLSASGGQRINRLVVEYYIVINTYYMVHKHWKYLKKNQGVTGGAIFWTLKYIFHHEWRQLNRVLRHGLGSSYKP